MAAIFQNNYKMRVKKAENRQPSKNQQIKNRLEARLSYCNVSHNQIKQANENFHKSKTQSINNEDLKEEEKENNRQIQVLNLDESRGPNERDGWKQKNEEPEEKITIKFKWASNFRNRKGSEDIALNRMGSTHAYKESTSFNEGRFPAGKINRENSGLSNQIELPHVTSFENRLENFQSNKGFKMMLEPSSNLLIQEIPSNKDTDLRFSKQKHWDKESLIKNEASKFENIIDRVRIRGKKL